VNDRRGVARRRVLPLVGSVAAIVMVVGVLLVIRGVVAESAAVRSAITDLSSASSPLEEGPIMVLGGGTERLDAALALDPVRLEGRELIASAGAGDDLAASGRSCDEPGIRCVTPEPLTTRGEARLARRLAAEEAWPALTVVTSDWHAHRAGRHFAACLDIPFRIIPVHYASIESIPNRLLWREALGALDARLRPECRDLAP